MTEKAKRHGSREREPSAAALQTAAECGFGSSMKVWEPFTTTMAVAAWIGFALVGALAAGMALYLVRRKPAACGSSCSLPGMDGHALLAIIVGVVAVVFAIKLLTTAVVATRRSGRRVVLFERGVIFEGESRRLVFDLRETTILDNRRRSRRDGMITGTVRLSDPRGQRFRLYGTNRGIADQLAEIVRQLNAARSAH